MIYVNGGSSNGVRMMGILFVGGMLAFMFICYLISRLGDRKRGRYLDDDYD